MTNSVPERWLQYKPYGDVIHSTKILPFKVPLKEAIARNLKPEERFTPPQLLQDFPHLKYIVDLTNTSRYYDKKEFTSAGVKYEKIAIPGRKIPTMDVIKKFFKVMDDFMSACGEGELIGVHCTHGINRTGYLICRYLIQQLDWEIQDSIKAFGEARGYSIERDFYITALQDVQRGKKIDTSKVVLTSASTNVALPKRNSKLRSILKNLADRPMGPPRFGPMLRRGFANDRPFSPQRFGPPPGFGPMPPPPGMPSIPPMNPPLYGPRPFRYGPPPMRQAIPPTPPGPSFPHHGFPPRIMPGPPRMTGPPRLPAGPTARIPPLKIPPPRSPPSSTTKQLQTRKKHQQIRNSTSERSRNIRCARQNGPTNNRIMSRIRKEQDFTVDTFEENLLTTSVNVQPRRRTRGRFNQAK